MDMRNQKTRNRRLTNLVVACAVGATVSLASSPASANFGKWYANNAGHTFYYSALTTGMTNASNWVRWNVINPTDLNTDLSGSTADVKVYDAYYGDVGWGGTSEGLSPANSPVCNQFRVRFNLSWAPLTNSTVDQRHVACHEFGHTVGLLHTTAEDSCLGGNGATEKWSSHDVSHVNGYYQ